MIFLATGELCGFPKQHGRARFFAHYDTPKWFAANCAYRLDVPPVDLAFLTSEPAIQTDTELRIAA